jgi:hypothetical protein
MGGLCKKKCDHSILVNMCIGWGDVLEGFAKVAPQRPLYQGRVDAEAVGLQHPPPKPWGYTPPQDVRIPYTARTAE